jgi:hypothetical protein
MDKLSGRAAPLLVIAALTLIALLLLSASYMAIHLGSAGIVCATRPTSLITLMVKGFEICILHITEASKCMLTR